MISKPAAYFQVDSSFLAANLEVDVRQVAISS
jgi:hypothetical protein